MDLACFLVPQESRRRGVEEGRAWGGGMEGRESGRWDGRGILSDSIMLVRAYSSP